MFLSLLSVKGYFDFFNSLSNISQYWSDFMNRSGEEQERLLALLEEEAQRTHSNKSHEHQREGLT